MGRKEKQAQMLFQKITKPRPEAWEGISCKEAWDRYYTMTGCDFYSESHADWSQLRTVITSYLSSSPPPVCILVPACGNSRLSEHMYDAGFTSITNVDFSSLVIAHMLNRNVRERPQMKWRVGDMTKLEQYANETFDAVVDKGGLDGLMNPELAPLSVTQYLYEVKRLLKVGGKYMCVTFGEKNVFAILFLKFRFGWNVSLHAIALDSSPGDIKQQAFIVVVEKLVCTAVSQISLCLADYEAQRHGNNKLFFKTDEFYGALEREQMIRRICSDDSDVFIPHEDLVLVAKANVSKLEPGRRLKLTIGDVGASRFFYDCILIDAPVDFGPFPRRYCVQVIANTPTLRSFLSVSEGQWYIVKACKAARLLMVILETRHADMSRKDMMTDISPFIKQLDPACADGGEYRGLFLIPHENNTKFASQPGSLARALPDFLPLISSVGIILDTWVTIVDDVVKNQEILHQALSALSGLIVVDDVIYKDTDRRFPDKYSVRRLNIESFSIAEALYTIEVSIGVSSDLEKGKATTSETKNVKQRNPHYSSSEPHGEASSSAAIKIDHSYLASPHHNAIISGLMLIYVELGGSTSAEIMKKTLVIGRIPTSEVKTVIIGLRAGLLSMFMNNCLPFLKIEVVEKDPLMLHPSRKYFGFREDERLKVHIGDGVEFVREIANSGADGKLSSKIDILIVDWELRHSRSSQGFTSPPAYFVDKSFLLDAKKSLSENGLFIINLISWSSTVRGLIVSKLKAVFSNVFSINLATGVNELIFAQNSESPVNDSELSKARDKLSRSFGKEEVWGQRVIRASQFIRPLK